MRNFIAKIGYTLMWGFGIPEYSLEEKFEEYYKIGMILIIITLISLVILLILLIYYFRKDKSE